MKLDYTKEEMKGRKIVIITNLKPANIRGVKSNGMLLAAEDDAGTCSLLSPGDAKPGSEIYIEGITKEPVSILEIDEFKQVSMVIGEDQIATYQGKTLLGEKGRVIADKPVKKGANIQ